MSGAQPPNFEPAEPRERSIFSTDSEAPQRRDYGLYRAPLGRAKHPPLKRQEGLTDDTPRFWLFNDEDDLSPRAHCPLACSIS